MFHISFFNLYIYSNTLSRTSLKNINFVLLLSESCYAAELWWWWCISLTNTDVLGSRIRIGQITPCNISSLQTAACLALIHPCLGHNPGRGIPSRDIPKADPDDGDRAQTGGCEVFFLDGACPLTEQNILGKSGFFLRLRTFSIIIFLGVSIGPNLFSSFVRKVDMVTLNV
jgi:hypothetical protein